VSFAMGFVVGIAGGSASGKSTLAAGLVQALQAKHGTPVHLVPTDSYFWEDKTREPQIYFQHESRMMFNYNHPMPLIIFDWSRISNSSRRIHALSLSRV
jgi:uridine kinase